MKKSMLCLLVNLFLSGVWAAELEGGYQIVQIDSNAQLAALKGSFDVSENSSRDFLIEDGNGKNCALKQIGVKQGFVIVSTKNCSFAQSLRVGQAASLSLFADFKKKKEAKKVEKVDVVATQNASVIEDIKKFKTDISFSLVDISYYSQTSNWKNTTSGDYVYETSTLGGKTLPLNVFIDLYGENAGALLSIWHSVNGGEIFPYVKIGPWDFGPTLFVKSKTGDSSFTSQDSVVTENETHDTSWWVGMSARHHYENELLKIISRVGIEYEHDDEKSDDANTNYKYYSAYAEVIGLYKIRPGLAIGPSVYALYSKYSGENIVNSRKLTNKGHFYQLELSPLVVNISF